jgi:hypothetical protein
MYYREILWCNIKQDLAHLLYYLNLFGTLIWRPRVVVLGGGCGGGDGTSTPLLAPTTRRFFVDFGAALREAARLPLFGVSRDFCEVAALRCCFLRARAAASSAALALRSSAARSLAAVRSAFASSTIFFLYSIDAALSSLSRLF